jgi:hypothetical protein
MNEIECSESGRRGVEGKEGNKLSQGQAHIDESLEHTSAVRM